MQSGPRFAICIFFSKVQGTCVWRKENILTTSRHPDINITWHWCTISANLYLFAWYFTSMEVASNTGEGPQILHKSEVWKEHVGRVQRQELARPSTQHHFFLAEMPSEIGTCRNCLTFGRWNYSRILMMKIGWLEGKHHLSQRFGLPHSPIEQVGWDICQGKCGVFVGCSSFPLRMSSLLLFAPYYLWTCVVWEMMKGQVHQKNPSFLFCWYLLWVPLVTRL